jgi:hypothetical protein
MTIHEAPGAELGACAWLLLRQGGQLAAIGIVLGVVGAEPFT